MVSKARDPGSVDRSEMADDRFSFSASTAPFDIVPRPEPNDHLNPIFCYLGEEGVKKYLTHP